MMREFKDGGYASLYPPYVTDRFVWIKAHRAESTVASAKSIMLGKYAHQERGLYRPYIWAVAMTLLLASPMARAAITLYGINNNTAAIQRIDPTTSAATTDREKR